MSSASESIRGRIPPHNEDAERALLGALLQDPDRIPDAVDAVSSDDFFARRHRLVFETLVDLSDRNVGVDLLSLGDALRAQGRLADVGGSSYLAELTALVSSSAHLRHHAEIVAESGTLRRLIAEATGVIEDAYGTPPDRESVGQLLDRSEHRVFSVGVRRGGGEVVPLADAMREAFERIDASSHRKEISGLPSGFYELDEMLGGFNGGELTIVAARPSMGKTALVLNVMDRVARARREGRDAPSVLFFSLEMGRMSIVQRMLCAQARVDAHKLRTGRIPNEDYADLVQAAGDLQASRIYVDDTPGLSVMAVRSRARRVKRNFGLDMIVIDYLQLMTAARAENRQQEISAISRALKELSRELDVPVIALSQLSRAVESRDDKRPLLSDLRESGSIEQDADVVLLLFREEYYNRTDENQGKAELICAKQRNGPTGTVRLQFTGKYMRFENLEPSMAEPIY